MKNIRCQLFDLERVPHLFLRCPASPALVLHLLFVLLLQLDQFHEFLLQRKGKETFFVPIADIYISTMTELVSTEHGKQFSSLHCFLHAHVSIVQIEKLQVSTRYIRQSMFSPTCSNHMLSFNIHWMEETFHVITSKKEKNDLTPC